MPTSVTLDLKLPQATLGEGAHWEAISERFFWVDIPKRRFHICHVPSGNVRSFDSSQPVSFVFPASPTKVWLGLADGIYSLDLENGIEQVIALAGWPSSQRRQVR